jgi:hypothetical protein
VGSAMNYRIVPFLGLVFALSGCATITEQNPVIDQKMSNMTNYNSDLSECREIAMQIDAGESFVKSATIGTLTGAAIGAVVGIFDDKNFGKSVGIGAAGGAVAGGIQGGLETFEDRKEIVAKCLDGRGYAVLMP